VLLLFSIQTLAKILIPAARPSARDLLVVPLPRVAATLVAVHQLEGEDAESWVDAGTENLGTAMVAGDVMFGGSEP
jgi:hypothetical protein